jgi:hypothetical protein
MNDLDGYDFETLGLISVSKRCDVYTGRRAE